MRGICLGAAILFAPISATVAWADDVLDKQTIDMLVGLGVMSREAAEKKIVFDNCVHAAVEKYADQKESAETIAKAALDACLSKEMEYRRSDNLGPETMDEYNEKFEVPELTSYVVKVRAERGASRGQ